MVFSVIIILYKTPVAKINKKNINSITQQVGENTETGAVDKNDKIYEEDEIQSCKAETNKSGVHFAIPEEVDHYNRYERLQRKTTPHPSSFQSLVLITYSK